jgi:hypothetical protein
MFHTKIVQKTKIHIFTFSNLFTNNSKLPVTVINLILWTFYVGKAQISPVFISTIGLDCSLLNLWPEDAWFQHRRSTDILISCSVVFLTHIRQMTVLQITPRTHSSHPFQDETKITLLTTSKPQWTWNYVTFSLIYTYNGLAWGRR